MQQAIAIVVLLTIFFIGAISGAVVTMTLADEFCVCRGEAA